MIPIFMPIFRSSGVHGCAHVSSGPPMMIYDGGDYPGSNPAKTHAMRVGDQWHPTDGRVLVWTGRRRGWSADNADLQA